MTSSLPTDADYAWEIAKLFPRQGHWSESDYIAFTDSTNRLIEFTDGKVEFLSMPTELHQAIVEFLFDAIRALVKSQGLGQVRFAPLRVRITAGKFRDPDIVFLLKKNFGKRSNEFWHGADLVVEVVSDDAESRKRDYQQKPLDYAEAGIPEYWIVDPQDRRISVLSLVGSTYRTAGTYAPGQLASSELLPSFQVSVDEVFAAGEEALEQR